MAKSSGKRIGLWVIMGLLFVGLIGFGGAGLSTGVRTLGTVEDKDIGVQTYANELNRAIQDWSQQLGFPLTFETASSIGIPDAVLAQLVSNRVLDVELDRMGISAGDDRVLAAVMAQPGFRDGITGSFDRATYRAALQNSGISVTEYEESLREQLARVLYEAALVGGLPEPEAYAATSVRFAGERRSFTWAELTIDQLGSDVPTPSNEDVAAYYEANPDLFTDPETRAITYVWITPDMMADMNDVDEDIVRQTYDDRIAEFVQEERRIAERLNMPDQESADDARTRLDAGDIGFDALVAERGLDLADVDLGDITQAALGAVGEVVFAAEAGEVIGPIATDLGPAFFRINAVLPRQEVTFEEAREDIEAEIATIAARRALNALQDPILDLVAGRVSLEEIAERTDMVLGTIDFSENETSGIAAYDAFRFAAGTAEEGQVPELIELSDGGLFVLRLDGITEPRLRPLDGVRDAALDGATSAARQAAISAEATRLVSQLATEGDFEALGLTDVTVEEDIIRSNIIETGPEGLVTQVFDMDEGEVRVIETEEGAVIVRLDLVASADTTSDAMVAQREAVLAQAGRGIALDLFTVVATELELRTEIDIDRNAVALVHQQFGGL